MVALILIVCLAATPDICREEQPPVDVANAMSCAVQGQLIAQEWLDEHPKWLLRSTRPRCDARPRRVRPRRGRTGRRRCRFGRAERAT